MSAKIEILDYSGIIESGSGTSTGFDLTSGTVNYCGFGGVSVTGSTLQYTNPGGANLGCYLMDTSTLIHGATYTFHYNVTVLNKIPGSNPTGRFWVLLDSAITQTYNSVSGMQSIVFTYDSSNPTGYQLQILNCNSATISNISMTGAVAGGNVDWANSIVGELDVTDHSDFPIAITFQVSDIKDITSTSGDYSKTFKLPATKNNNKLLRHPFATNIDEGVRVYESRKCRITINDSFYLLGLIKVTGIGGYGEEPSYYDCVFYGNNLNWSQDLSNSYMTQLNWGSGGKGLTVNRTSIINTWQTVDSITSALPIVYPITSYGDYNPDGEPNTIQLLDTAYEDAPFAGNVGKDGYYGFYNSGSPYPTPIPCVDWRPAIFVLDTLERIFKEAGYVINSSFMQTSMFKKLVWLLPNFKYNNASSRFSKYSAEADFDTSVALPTGTISDPYTGSQFSYTWPSYVIDLGTINTNFTLSQNTSSTNIVYNGSDNFTIAEYGNYTISASGLSARLDTLLQNGAIPASTTFNGVRLPELYIDNISFRLQLKTVGQTSWNDIDSLKEDTLTTFLGSPGAVLGSNILINAVNFYDWNVPGSVNFNGFLNKGDKVRIRVVAKMKPHNTSGAWSGVGTWSFNTTPTIGSFDITLAAERVDYGQTYDLSEVINPDYKQIDFIKGISHAFNLTMTTNEATKVVTIEPFNAFYKDYGEAIDWTYKLDRSKKIEDKWTKSDLKRDIVFKYKTDSADKKVAAEGNTRFDGIPDQFPYTETLPTSFEKGERKFENPFFAGTFNGRDQDTIPPAAFTVVQPFSSCLWAENAYETDLDRPDKGYDFLPRLLYWNKFSPASNALNMFAYAQTWGYTNRFIIADNSVAVASPGVLSNIYPQATSINSDDSLSPILSYGNVNVRTYYSATGTYSSYSTGKGLFDTYYKQMFEMLKTNPRLRNAYIDLKTKDVLNLDFQKLVYIDGIYWRVNKIIDYQPNKNQSTKVELIEWLNTGDFAATPAAAASFSSSSSFSNTYGGYNDPPNAGFSSQ